MELLLIDKYPDKILKKNCVRVDEVTDKEKELFENMLFTMRHFAGIGLAAPQIGISKRLIVAEVEEKVIKLANPEIIETKGAEKMEEGCLSVPDTIVKIERPYEASIKGLNEKGDEVEIKTEGLLARVLQHEIDHLDGRLIIDYMTILEELNFKLKHRKF